MGVCCLRNHESELLYHALCYEEGHPRRTQHILKVYTLAKLLGEKEALSEKDRQILQAAAILHDIAIKYCKEHYAGDACQANQQREAPHLVCNFLDQAEYPAEHLPRILELVLLHHDYTDQPDPLLRLLIEADLIVNCYESTPTDSELNRFRPLFHSETGKTLFDFYVKHKRSQEEQG